MLADEEAKHYKAIENMQHSGEQTLGRSSILGETRNTFEQLRDDPNAKITARTQQEGADVFLWPRYLIHLFLLLSFLEILGFNCGVKGLGKLVSKKAFQ